MSTPNEVSTAQTPPDNGPAQIDVSSQYPTAARVENGTAYDVSGKALGSVDALASASKQPQDPWSAPGIVAAPAPASKSGDPWAAPGIIAAPAPAQTPVPLYKQAAAQATSIGPRGQATGKGLPWDEKHGISPAQFDSWLDDVQADVKNGTASTWVGSVLHYFGAKGTEYGVAPGASQMSMVGGVPGGAAEALQGPVEIGAGHYVRGTNKVVSGAMQAAAPSMLVQPEAMAVVVPAIVAGKLASSAATKMGADEDTAELVGNVAAIVAGGGAASKVHVDAFGNAVNGHMAASEVYDTRVKEVTVAKDQAIKARLDAQTAQEAFEAGKGTKEEANAAQTAASVAAKNATTAQEALKLAAEDRAHAAVDVANAAQKITKGKKIPTPATAKDIAKSKADFQTAIPSGPGKSAYTDEDYDVVRPYLEKHHAAQSPVNNPEAVYDALESQRVGIENRVKPWIQEYGKEALLLTDDGGKPVSVKQKLIEALTPDDKITAGFLDEGLKELEKYNTTDPSVSEADALRKVLNDENRAILQKNHWDVATARATDPAFAARYELNDILRDGVYDRLIDKGVKGARELRQDERSIIPVRNAADRMIPKTNVVARGTGEASSTRKAAAWLTRKAGIGAGAAGGVATGIPGAAEAGAIVGGVAGDWAAQKIAPSGLTRAQLIERSMKVKATNGKTTEIDATGAQPSNPPVEPLPPPVLASVHPQENSTLHAALIDHFDETPGDPNTSYPDLVDRLKQEVKIYTDRSVPVPDDLKKLKLQVVTAEVAEAKAAQDAAVKVAKEAAKAAEKAAKETPPKAPAPGPSSKELGATAAEESPLNANIQRTSTGDAKLDEAIEKGGGIPGGIQPGVPGRYGDFAWFHDPQTRSSLMLPTESLTAEKVAEHIAASRVKFAKENPFNAETRFPFVTEPHTPLPEEDKAFYTAYGFSPEQVAYHEAAHHVLMHENGFESIGTIGQEHPEAKKVGGLARADWDQSQFFHPKTGYINADAVRDRLGDLITQLSAGPVADELHFGIKMENNKGAAADFKNINRLMEIAKVPIDDKAAMIEAAQARAKEVLTRPGYHEILSKYTSRRETGISKEYLMAPDTVQDMLKELDEVKQNGKATEARGVNEPASAGLRGRGGENVARGEGEGVEGTARGALPAAAAQARTLNAEGVAPTQISAKTHPISQKLIDKYGTTDEPLKAGFILADGRMVPLKAMHPEMIAAAQGKSLSDLEHLPMEDLPMKREDFINGEKVIRTRYRIGKGGNEVVFSVPESGVNEDQILQMRRAAGQMRNGNAVIEVAKPKGKSVTKEFVRPSDIDPMLREVGVHPEENPLGQNLSYEAMKGMKEARESEDRARLVNAAPPTPTPELNPAKIQGGEHATPAPTYHEASQTEGNPWVRKSADATRSAAPTNSGRQLMVQFSSDLINKGGPSDTSGEYYDKLYSGARPGYARLKDFWEIPQWMGFVAHNLPDADVYVVRDMAQAKQFLNNAGYDRVLFSALDVNKNLIRELAKDYKGHIDVGGYVEPGTFLDRPNVKYHPSVESLATEVNGPGSYKNGTDYRHFEGSDVIPRLTMSDGCLHKCAFCVVTRKLTTTPEEVVDQQADSMSKLGAKLVYLNDKTFGQAPNYQHLSDVYTKMKDANPDFKGFVVQTTAAQLTKIPSEWLGKSGIKYVELGVESYNDPILKEMHKPANEKLIDQATQKLREHGIALIPNILVGLPGETAETYAHTLDFLNRNKDIISHANIYNLAVYPDAELAKKLTTASEGDFNENVLEKSFHSDPKVHRQFAGDLYGTAQNMLEGKPSSAALDMWAKAPEANGLKRIEDLKPEDLQFEEGRRNWAARAVESHRTTGGFTIHPETGMVPEKGHVIEVSPEHRQPVEGVLQPEDVEKFHQENKKLFAENPELHVGGYGNQLNVSAVGTPEGARLVGNKLDQESGWDAEKHQVVPYEGKGVQTKFPDYPLAQRLAELKGTPENPLNAEVNATPAMKKLVDETPWVEDKKTGYRLLNLTGKHGEDIGELQYSGGVGDSYSRIRVSHIEPKYRNQGIGKAMYESAIEDARKMGIPEFKSDTMVSNDAQNVWNSLMREGKYNITKEYTKNFNANGGGGVEYTVHLNEPKENPLNAEVRAPRLVDGQDVVEHLMKTAKIDENEAMGRTGTYGAGKYALIDVPIQSSPKTPAEADKFVAEPGKVFAGDDYNPALAKKYADKPTEIPAIVLGPDGDVRDGNHRIAAAEMRGDKTVKAYVPVGYDATEKMIATSQGKAPAATPEESFAFGRNVEGTPDQQKGLVSTRVPSGPKSIENPVEKDLTIGREAIDQVPGMSQKMADLVREYPGVDIPKNIKDPTKVLNRFVDHVKENLKTLYNNVSPERREANMKWYDSANKLASNLAEKYGRTTKQLAGVIASMSPQKDWDMNVGLAERVNDIFHTQKDTQTSPEMLQKGQEIVTKTNWKDPLTAKANRNLSGALPAIVGRTLGELTDPVHKAAWIRLYDEAHNPRQYHSIDPATGESRGLATDDAGAPRRIVWGSLNEIAKAVSILEDGSRENISDKLGDAHKVRNFYNNILDPSNPRGDVTIDTHAVGAGLMRMVSGKSTEVLHNFGGGGAPGSSINGVSGTYALYADAYRAAAKDLGILPRQLQSVVWEEIRNMFPAEMKRIPKRIEAVNDIWRQYGDGKISLDKAHEMVQDYAKQAAGEMTSNRAAGKISAHQFLEKLGQGGLFALAGGKK